MQKNLKASILIWAIFLSLIISISFLSISSKITKNFKNNNINNKILQKNNKIENILKTSSGNSETFDNIYISIENSSIKKSLKKYETFKINFPKNSNITLKLLTPGVLLYNSGTNTGILDNNNNILNTSINQNNFLTLKNLSGYIKFELNSDNKFDLPEKKYKIIEKIGNKNIIKQFGILK